MNGEEISTVCFVVYDSGNGTFLTKYLQWSPLFNEAFIHTFPNDAYAAMSQHGRHPHSRVLICRVNTTISPDAFWQPED